MKDIDFDELDRAVGSILGGEDTPKTDFAAAGVSGRPVNQGSGQDGGSSQPPVFKSSASPARKRGQFLDMVHPSADMRTKTSLPIGPRKTLAPLAAPGVRERAAKESEPEPAAADQPIPAQPGTITPPVHDPDEPAETVSEHTEIGQTGVADNTAWPDPLDVVTTEPPDVPEPDLKSDRTDAISGFGHDEPAQTPFVPGVAVEKRPLGAPQTGGTDDHDLQLEVHEEDPEEGSATTDTEGPSPEFGIDVNSVESNEIQKSEYDQAVPEPEVSDTESQAARPDTVQPASTGGIAQSISQQYQPAKQQTEDEGQHPLFDAEEYRQPLLAAGTKKRGKGLVIIVLLVILLLVGGVLGYLAYTMGL